MVKSSAVTAVTIIVDNSREGPFWLELKDYRQCNSVQPLQSFKLKQQKKELPFGAEREKSNFGNEKSFQIHFLGCLTQFLISATWLLAPEWTFYRTATSTQIGPTSR